jgi:hypothetical protein
MSMKRWIVLVCVALLAASLTVAIGEDKKKDTNEDQSSDGTSFNLYYATYMAKAGRIEVVASSYGSSYEEADKFFMLQVAVGVIGKFGKELDFTDKSFTLLDPAGNLYSMAPPTALANELDLLEYADELQNSDPLQLGKDFVNLERVNSDFYATQENIAWANVHLNYDSYFSDVIFFPKPTSGFDGVFTLNVLTPGMEEMVTVRFKVPEPKEKKKDTEEKKG